MIASFFKKSMKYSLADKEKNVQEMFSSIAGKYDLNNTLLSLGMHTSWKKRVVRLAQIRDRSFILDIASGTGDIAIQMAENHNSRIKIVASDLNREMLIVGVQKIRSRGLASRVSAVLGNAEAIQFRDRSFDVVTVGFGMRNFTDILKVLREVLRVLKPGGQFICLEFSKPVQPFWRKLYDIYSSLLLPKIGTWVSKDKTGVYQYLHDSIRNFPDQEKFKSMMIEAGFSNTGYINLTGGIVAIHMGFKSPA